MAETDYAINYDDERFTKVETEKNAAMTQIDGTYADMIGQSDSFYQQQIDASKQWADKQSQLQQEKSDFAIEQIEQQKEQSHKDYLKEQAASYVDWQKQSNAYGTEAEKIASAGLTNTGFSESSQVAMYNQYQNRVATAREVFAQATLNFNNAIKDARLQNNAVLAEIAFNAYKEQAQLALEGFQYKNNLILEQANKKLEVDNMYYNRYQDVLQQINHENAMAEDIRQFNETQKFEMEKFNEEKRQFEQNYQLQVEQFNKEYDLEMRKFDENIRQFNEEIERLKKKDEQEHKLEIEKLELAKQQEQRAKEEFKKEMDYKYAVLQEEKRQFNAQQASKTAPTYKSGGTTYTGKSGSNPTLKSGATNTSTKTTYSKARSNHATQQAKASGTSKNYPINMQSVLALGYGPISSSYLAKLQAQGKVTSYVKNGQTYFKSTAGNSTATSYLRG